MELTDKLTAIGDAIRAKIGTEDLLTLDQMATEITNMETGGGGELPEEALTITDSCQYKFAYDGWNWFINEYGNKITTNDLINCDHMFYYSEDLEHIPFELNCYSGTNIILNYLFAYARHLKEIPKINSCSVQAMEGLFRDCWYLPSIPEDIGSWFDWSSMDTGSSSGSRSYMFYECRSLRKIPMDFLNHGNPNTRYSETYFYNGFSSCFNLDELVGLPIPYTATYSINTFTNGFQYCHRLKNITFALNNGAPYVVNWKNQKLLLDKWVGYAYDGNIGQYTPIYDATKKVTDDATYQALKNDPDWWTEDINYSRFNHDSAVATINSLPDTSAYGTNTITFKGTAGALTDGGAINTLTEEEIAVATSKGWTVSLS